MITFSKDLQYYKFCLYGFLKNLRFFEPFLYLFFLEKGLSFFQIGTLITIREITRNLVEIPTGLIADTLGRRRTMIFSFLFYICSFLFFFFFNSYAVFIPAMILYSFGDAFRSGTHKAMIFEYLSLKNRDDQKVHYYGHTRSWSQMGSAISSLLAAALVFYTGAYKYIFLFTLIPYLLDLFLMFSYPASLDGKRQNLSLQAIRAGFVEVLQGTKASFRKGFTIRLLNNMSVFSGYLKATKDYLQPLLAGMVVLLPTFSHFSKVQSGSLLVGVVYFTIYILTSLSARFSGRIVEFRLSSYKLLNITLLTGFFAGTMAGFFYIRENQWLGLLSILFFILLYLVENLRRPVGVSVIADNTNRDVLATVLSVESQARGLYAALFAPVIGFLADRAGIGLAMFVLSLFLLAIFPLFRLTSTPPKPGS